MAPYELTLYLDDRRGPVRLIRGGHTLAGAVYATVAALEARGVRVTRLDADDWVTLHDLAVRIGRSRETVRLWAHGRAGPGGFPPPVNPGRRTLFYSWAEVGPWLYRRAGVPLDPGAVRPDLAAAALALQLRALLPRTRDPVSILALVTGWGG